MLHDAFLGYDNPEYEKRKKENIELKKKICDGPKKLGQFGFTMKYGI